MKNTEDFYNATAHQWADSGYRDDAAIPSLLAFAKRYPAGSRFLDLCCGCGYDAARVHALGYDVVGIDLSEESLKIARERNPGIAFYHDNLLNDYSYIGKVDAIFVIAGLIHIETEHLPRAFASMWNVLKEGGGLFVTVREGEGKLLDRSIQVIDGVAYDRNFIGHSRAELSAAASGLFAFQGEVGWDGTAWHNYIFRRCER